jgi:hypothetical protein
MKSTNETRALAHEILAYWLRFNKHEQTAWVGDTVGLDVNVKVLNEKSYNVCNTTMCAAGTAVFLSNTPKEFIKFAKTNSYDDWMHQGGEALGLDVKDAEKVFLSDKKSAKRYMRAIASGKQSEFDKATYKRVSMDS